MSQCTKPDALKVQVAGNHYAKLAIQPAEFVMANRWDACAFSILKYLTRFRDKNGLQDLKKARHFVDLRVALLPVDDRQAPATIGIYAYCQANGLTGAVAQALCVLDCWVQLGGDLDRLEVIVAIENLMQSEYPNERV